ncbi:hemolysin family protein [Rubrivirga sp. IMCC43871]|uniref:hemolysin family protein n=1 Tax=Rubrivirga sp. IMCC43871 TaxID=3391575 RepID=UPI00398FE64A
MTVFLILLMLALSAFFSGSEIAFVTANRLKTQARARQAGWLGTVVQEFMDDPGTFLTTTLVGNNIALVVYSTLMSLALEPPLTRFFGDTVGLAETGAAVLTTQTIIAAVIVLVIGEVIPKSLLRQPPIRVLFLLAAPLKLTYGVFWLLIKAAGWVSGLFVRIADGEGTTVQQFLRRDFELAIRESRETGTLDLDEEESEILTNVFELRSLRVKDSMIPRTEIRAVDETATIEEVRQTFIETGFSRLPVYHENVDRIVGVVLAHDLFHAPETLSSILRPARVVPDSKPARDLLFDFLQGGATLAVAVDEYGGTAGIVTLEDLLEELFGDIRDEHDAAAAPIRRVDDRTVLVHGRVELEALEDAVGIVLDDGDYDTVAGFVLAHVGNVPDERDAFDHAGFRFTVITASQSRIDAVRIERL